MMSSSNASITPLKRKIKEDGTALSEDLRFVKSTGSSTLPREEGEEDTKTEDITTRNKRARQDEGPAAPVAFASSEQGDDNKPRKKEKPLFAINTNKQHGTNDKKIGALFSIQPLVSPKPESRDDNMEPDPAMIPLPPPPAAAAAAAAAPPVVAGVHETQREDDSNISGQAPPPPQQQQHDQVQHSHLARRSSSVLVPNDDSSNIDQQQHQQQQHQHLHSNPFAMEPMIDIDATDSMIRKAAFITVCSWIVCVSGAYAVHSRWDYNHGDYDDDPKMDDTERLVPKTAFFVLLVSLLNQLLPWLKRVVNGNSTSGVAVSASTALTISLLTNALLAWGPSAVVIDPVTGSRVFLIRWCEWVPLSFLMTLMAESTDVAASPSGWRMPITNALCQSLSTSCGLLFPYCQTKTQWVVLMLISCALFVQIFPRAKVRRHLLSITPQGKTVLEREYYDRRKFAWYLMGLCCVTWSTLVVCYFINMVIHLSIRSDHWLRKEALAMTFDTFFDVLSKVIFNRIIFHAHQAIFDSDVRNSRQLTELKELMSLLWVSSSDVIVVSKQQTPDQTVSMLSPSFLQMVGANPPLKTSMNPQDNEETQTGTGDDGVESTKNSRRSPALVVVTDKGQLTSAHYVDSLNATIAEDTPQPILAHEELQHNAVTQALQIINTAWSTRSSPGHPSETLQALSISHCDPSRSGKVMCELKALRYSEKTTMAVVRDVTERHRRFEAESRAHAETIARQRDMHTANRFTRHEVKNGLLAGIELCNTLGQCLSELQVKVAEVGNPTGSTLLVQSSKSVVDLDDTLRGVLDTVMAEVMAREVVHEVYQPRLEELDIPKMLVAKLGMSKDRIPVNVRGGSMPKLRLDAQLIGHIHRNAVSNACKYGKQGGKVQTYVHFDNDKKEFSMEVTNEPGFGHEDLIALGESASEFVFAQGVRLQPHIKNKKEQRLDSSGDGAWIMQKCAKTMNGTCNIHFYKNITRFTMSCPAVPIT